MDEERRGGGVDAGKDLFGAASDKDGTKRAVKKILSALGLKLPNLIVSVAETDGDDIEGEKDPDVPLKDPTLLSKTSRLVRSMIESSREVEGWVLPRAPRRSDVACRWVCDALPDDGSCVVLGSLGLDSRDSGSGGGLAMAMRDGASLLGMPPTTAIKIFRGDSVSEVDSNPPPELTHLVVFETVRDEIRFRNSLLDTVPDLILAFGPVSRSGMKAVIKCLFESRRREGVERRRRKLELEPLELDLGASPKRGRDRSPPKLQTRRTP